MQLCALVLPLNPLLASLLVGLPILFPFSSSSSERLDRWLTLNDRGGSARKWTCFPRSICCNVFRNRHFGKRGPWKWWDVAPSMSHAWNFLDWERFKMISFPCWRLIVFNILKLTYILNKCTNRCKNEVFQFCMLDSIAWKNVITKVSSLGYATLSTQMNKTCFQMICGNQPWQWNTQTSVYLYIHWLFIY